MGHKAKLLAKNPLFLALVLFVASVLLVNPLGEFTINDDWIFSRQILAFRLGMWKMSSLMDPIFISQGIAGYLWSLIFGYSHTSLRILTILITMVSAVGLYKIARLFDLKRTPTFILICVYLFNPLVYTSAFSFMTENYFLVFLIWNLYYYLEYVKKGNRRDLVIGTVFCALATLVRQVGVFTLLSLAILGLRRILKWEVLAIMSSAFLLFLLFPRYPISQELENLSVFSNSFSNLAEWGKIPPHLPIFPFILTYFGFFLLPMFFAVERKPLLYQKIWVFLKILIALVVTLKVMEVDVFPIGGVFYLEGLHMKSWPFSNFSIFDNLFFKVFVSALMSFSALYFIEFLVKKTKKYSSESKLLFYTAVFHLFVLLLSGAFYDRYLLPSFTAVLILFAINHSYETRLGKACVAVAFLIFITVSLQMSYLNMTRLSWKQAALISEKYNITTDIFVLGLYRRYMHAVSTEDFVGYDKFAAGDYKCYVQPYTVDSNSKVLVFLQKVHKIAEDKIFENPSIYNGRKPDGIPRAKNHLQELDFNEEYLSPLYNLVGKKAYVGSFCVLED